MEQLAPITITVTPSGATVPLPAHLSLLKAAQAAGIEITATCGGRGRCTSCRIKFLAGPVPPPTIMDEVQLGPDQVREGYRLACQTRCDEDATIQIAPPLEERGFQILGAEHDLSTVQVDSGVEKRFLTVMLPREEHHQTSDIEETCRLMGADPGGTPLELIRTLPALLREDKGQVTATTVGGRLITVEPGDTADAAYGIAIDVGTTSVVTSLIDLTSGASLASASSLNPQAIFGGDLMSRIAFAQSHPGNLRKLQVRILGLVNQQIAQVCQEAAVSPQQVYKVVFVGNTGMHHILLGIDPTHVGLAPYAPVMRHPYQAPARELGLRVCPHARVFSLPIVAGFVGADAVAVTLATRLYESREVRCAVDIGTNGEVVMGSRDTLMACSAPAGPAFEGAQIRHGMRGAAGAIDKVAITDDVRYTVIGGGQPQGICGSGIIDALAGMLDVGIIDWLGLIRVDERGGLPTRLGERVRMVGKERQFVLAWGSETATGQEIVISQDDVRQVQLAKGAIFSGIVTLQRIMDVPDDRLSEIMLAGGFGNYVNIRSAVRIGLIPPLPLDRVRYVGNAAALGAQMVLVSETERRRAEEVARRIEHVSLAAHPDFQDTFIDAMNFPRG